MKKLLIVMMIAATIALLTTAPVFSQNVTEKKSTTSQLGKHQFLDQYFGVNIGASGMKTGNNGILTADIGVNYNLYLHKWVSISTGFILHMENYFNHNYLTNNDHMMIPFCFTIPFSLNINIPKIEWLYLGIGAGINIPITDLKSPKVNNALGKNNVFFSLPVDFGFDFIKSNKGSRLFVRVTPTFYKGGITVPVGFVWQIYNWRVYSRKIDVYVETPKIEVNVPPPVIIQ